MGIVPREGGGEGGGVGRVNFRRILVTSGWQREAPEKGEDSSSAAPEVVLVGGERGSRAGSLPQDGDSSRLRLLSASGGIQYKSAPRNKVLPPGGVDVPEILNRK